jgi:hypothetical protein
MRRLPVLMDEEMLAVNTDDMKRLIEVVDSFLRTTAKKWSDKERWPYMRILQTLKRTSGDG